MLKINHALPTFSRTIMEDNWRKECPVLDCARLTSSSWSSSAEKFHPIWCRMSQSDRAAAMPPLYSLARSLSLAPFPEFKSAEGGESGEIAPEEEEEEMLKTDILRGPKQRGKTESLLFAILLDMQTTGAWFALRVLLWR